MDPTAAFLAFKTWLLTTGAEWQPALAILTPTLVFISACIAYTAIRKNQDVNRRRATIDLIEKSESSEHYRTILTSFRDSLSNGVTVKQREKLHAPKNDTEKKARRCVQQFLNHYELVAIGILGKSLHERTYRDWMMTVFIRDWNLAVDYIQRERWQYDEIAKKWRYRARVYRGFEHLAIRWGAKCGLKVAHISQTTSLPPAVPSGPGDIAVPELGDEAEGPLTPSVANNPSKSGSRLKPSRRPSKS